MWRFRNFNRMLFSDAYLKNFAMFVNFSNFWRKHCRKFSHVHFEYSIMVSKWSLWWVLTPVLSYDHFRSCFVAKWYFCFLHTYVDRNLSHLMTALMSGGVRSHKGDDLEPYDDALYSKCACVRTSESSLSQKLLKFTKLHLYVPWKPISIKIRHHNNTTKNRFAWWFLVTEPYHVFFLP